MKQATIADVAAAAGVSMMTVSRAINGKEGVSSATRRRVLDIAQELGYRPSKVARGLVTRRTGTIGLVVPDIANPFFAGIARGVEDVAYVHSLTVFLLNTSEDVPREERALDSLTAQQVDGLILCSARQPEGALQRQLTRFDHVVLVNCTLDTPPSNSATINVDDSTGSALAVLHLVARGRRRIALVAGPRNSRSGRQRLAGYLAGLAQSSPDMVDQAQEVIVHCPPSSEGGRTAMLALLDRRPALDAVIAYNDLVAVGVLQACRERSVAVPDQVALVGADDIPLARLITPALTTLRIDMEALGRQAMEMLLAKMEGAEDGRDVLIRPELVVRET